MIKTQIIQKSDIIDDTNHFALSFNRKCLTKGLNQNEYKLKLHNIKLTAPKMYTAVKTIATKEAPLISAPHC